ncbi:DUF3087 domain-containing protein [Shewanella olleyana]|uniref:DUF3087 domain-containing protein n=1 Tax=Shewanella olleyana TaxID=135626 RepID=UPI00200D5CE3|nr:DUF3087 domain-containing protein [Shewanella olleyana]MCL1068834.1 DUF3087 domain-containing protein [Shewanella olleyana]
MQFISIDKPQYRKRLNILLISLVASLTILSLAFGGLLIELFGSDTVIRGESTGNFHLNFIGVILAVVSCSLVMNWIKTKPYMKEIYWVWQVKQLQNRIYRKLKKIVAAAQENDVNAITILLYYYHSQKKVYELDNNTLTMSKVETDINSIEQQISDLNLAITLDDFSIELIDKV